MASHRQHDCKGRRSRVAESASKKRWAIVRDAARNHWPELLRGLGIPESALTGRDAVCPSCGCPGFKFEDLRGRGTFTCARPDGATLSGDGFDLLQHVHGWGTQRVLLFVATCLGLAPERVTRQVVQLATDLASALQTCGSGTPTRSL